jgi:hypothetical protein
MSERSRNMKLSKVLHVISVIAGLIGGLMWFLLIFAWFTGATWFAVTTDLMLMIGCTIFSFLAAIWLQIATIYHMMLEKRGEII